ncbi:MAG TPA: type II toxin-antitoxin system PemK/MazF family toxin [Streptosporangiaceae bacterium]
MAVPLRGQVFHVDLPVIGPHYWLVVSNNRRNEHFEEVITVILTTTAPKSARPSCVPLVRNRDRFEGWVDCDDIGPLNKDELGPVKGSLSPPTMRLVDIGLAFALSLPRPA